MKVLLLKDVYKLGRAGEVKKVADGYGRNYLLPQGLAVLATEGALRQADKIRKNAEQERQRLNEELSAVSEQLEELTLSFPMKAGETDKLYGSVTTMMIAESIEEETGIEIDKRDIDSEPIKSLGVHNAAVRLTIDLVPEVTILVHREGEPPESAYEIAAEESSEEMTESFAELKEELEEEQEGEEEISPEELAEEVTPEGLEPEELEEGA
ncbi:MAG: 50S ribosomal protein L9 [Anaerolineales bacterium]|nr:50S ribosomal protein L9 [Anaerolineales bacterium]